MARNMMHWTKNGYGWSADASSFSLYNGERFCPACRRNFTRSGAKLTPLKGSDADVLLWYGRCCCGAVLTINND
jgi:hypothetical protein